MKKNKKIKKKKLKGKNSRNLHGEGSRKLCQKANQLIIQKRLSHYLKAYRVELDTNQTEITQEALATILGVSASMVAKLESLTPYPRVHAFFEYFKSFADLEGHSVSEFCSILEGSNMSQKSAFHKELADHIATLTVTNQIALSEAFRKKPDAKTLNTSLKAAIVLMNASEADRKNFLYLLKKIES